MSNVGLISKTVYGILNKSDSESEWLCCHLQCGMSMCFSMWYYLPKIMDVCYYSQLRESVQADCRIRE